MPKQKYYVVWKGRKTGIFTTWEETSSQVNGFTGAQYKAFESRTAAEQAYQTGYTTVKGKPFSAPNKSLPDILGGPILDSACVDAACSGNPGVLEYRGVYTRARTEFFHHGPFQRGTNNIGEFLAIVQALMLFKQQGSTLPIYSDSRNAISWVKAKKCKTQLPREPRTAGLFDLIDRAELWLKENSYSNKILKWDTSAWGEIPADFGRK